MPLVSGGSDVVSAVQGPVRLAELGRAIVQEYVLIRAPGAQWDPSAVMERDEVVERAADGLIELRERHRVNAVIDPCPIELGRDPELLADVAERSGVHIICATGFDVEADGWGIPFYWRQRHPEEIAELFIAELERGIKGTGIKPGVIKIGTGTPVGVHERKVLRAAALASRQTGVAIITSAEECGHGVEQQRLLLDGGADPSRCLIGDQDGNTVDELAVLADRGTMVSIDRIGWSRLGADEDRADLVVGAFRRGFGSSICLSQRRVSTIWSPKPGPWASKYAAVNAPQPGIIADHTSLFTTFLPLLEERGMTPNEIESLLVANPCRLLGGSPRSAPETSDR